jgi:hypothetical protein
LSFKGGHLASTVQQQWGQRRPQDANNVSHEGDLHECGSDSANEGSQAPNEQVGKNLERVRIFYVHNQPVTWLAVGEHNQLATRLSVDERNQPGTPSSVVEQSVGDESDVSRPDTDGRTVQQTSQQIQRRWMERMEDSGVDMDVEVQSLATAAHDDNDLTF